MELPKRKEYVEPGGENSIFTLHGVGMTLGELPLSEDARIEMRVRNGIEVVYECHNIDKRFPKVHETVRHQVDSKNVRSFIQSVCNGNVAEARRSAVAHVSRVVQPIVKYKQNTMYKPIASNYEYALFNMINLNQWAQSVGNGRLVLVNPSKGTVKRAKVCGLSFCVAIVPYEGGDIRKDKEVLEEFFRTCGYKDIGVITVSWKTLYASHELLYLGFSGDKGDRHELRHYIGFEMNPYAAAVKGYTIGAISDEGDRFVVDYVRPDYTQTQHYLKTPISNRYMSDVIVSWLSLSSGWRKESANPLFNLRSSFDLPIIHKKHIVATPAVQIDSFYTNAHSVGVFPPSNPTYVIGTIGHETYVLDLVSPKSLANRRSELKILDDNGILPYELKLPIRTAMLDMTYVTSDAYTSFVNITSIGFNVEKIDCVRTEIAIQVADLLECKATATFHPYTSSVTQQGVATSTNNARVSKGDTHYEGFAYRWPLIKEKREVLWDTHNALGGITPKRLHRILEDNGAIVSFQQLSGELELLFGRESLTSVNEKQFKGLASQRISFSACWSREARPAVTYMISSEHIEGWEQENFDVSVTSSEDYCECRRFSQVFSIKEGYYDQPFCNYYGYFDPGNPPDCVYVKNMDCFVRSLQGGPHLFPVSKGPYVSKQRYADARGIPLLKGRLMDLMRSRNYLDDHLWIDVIGTVTSSVPPVKRMAK